MDDESVSSGPVATVVHVSAHPDDEALGAPATLLLLRRAGWTVVHALVGLGRSADHERRRREAVDAAQLGGFELVLPDAPFAIASTDDLDAAQPQITEWLHHLLTERAPAIVVSSSPHDAHPGHELVARATKAAISAVPQPTAWWMWGLWADLPRPNVYVPFGDAVLAEAQGMLAAYAGELERNDYARLLEARATANAVLGSERVFGFGQARASAQPFAELLAELWHSDGRWQPGPARVLDPTDPVRR
jgi:LmbE family N-acetylglucosaminyl deacetylase